MKETEVQKKILKKLREHKIFCWRVNNMGVPDPNAKGGWRKQNGFNMPGMSDILGVFNKKFLAIEVKAPGRIKNVSEKQQKFIDKVKKNGGVAFVADSWELVKKKLKL
jgi:penicillin-binding protein-related factor A (putative recombinase)